jgi:hypothetical protein
MYSEVSIYAKVLNETTNSITPVKTAFTIFDISQLILCVILLLQQYRVMFVARESALIFIDEHVNSRMSEMLRRKNLYIHDAPTNNKD